MSLGRVTLSILRLLLLIGQLGCLEYLICKTSESVAVSVLVLSLGVKIANAIQETFEFARPGPIHLMTTRLLYHADRTDQFSLLVVALR
jgi:hypothetical protein